MRSIDNRMALRLSLLALAGSMTACTTAGPTYQSNLSPAATNMPGRNVAPSSSHANSQLPPGNCLDEPVFRGPYPATVVVGRGDTLCRIAKRYQTTIQAIVDVNRLPSSLLPVGARLRMPSPEYYSKSPYGPLRRR